ncbi:hypothetical protein BFJ69_g863 [Fusarium oxysporum]|uniref:Uncharacterized protein n=1 Tax=Fusarium oxysporum TaxID=5507 RepID=A0A420P280_FUSOX|nr:hypothetical protein BFJ69_g863 [Fusarium oxysporum]
MAPPNLGNIPSQHYRPDPLQDLSNAIGDMAIRWLDKDMGLVAFTNYFIELCETHKTLQQSFVEIKEIENANTRGITECIDIGQRVSLLNAEAPSCKAVIDALVEQIRDMILVNLSASSTVTDILGRVGLDLIHCAESMGLILIKNDDPYADEATFALVRVCKDDCEWIQREITLVKDRMTLMGTRIMKHKTTLSRFLQLRTC